MIIINDEPMKDHNITDDNIIYDITTDKSMKNNDVLKYIVSHNGALPQGTEVKAYLKRYNGKSLRDVKPYNLKENINYETYGTYYDDDDITDADDINSVIDNTESLRRDYFNYKNKYLHYEDKYAEIAVDKDSFLIMLQDNMNILPTLMNEDITVEEKLKYSEEGRKLMLPDFLEQEYTHNNPFPELMDIKFYDSLNPYEKRIIENEHYHHLYLVKSAEAIKEGRNKDRLITDEMITGRTMTIKDDKSRADFLYTDTSLRVHFNDVKEKLDAAFKKEKGRSPFVLDDITLALLKEYNGKVTDEVINNYVRKFNVQAFKKVAKYHNATLDALADKVNYSEMPDEHILVIASTLSAENITLLEKKGFFEWYNAHKKGLSVNELTLALKDDTIARLTKYDKDKSIQDTLYDIGQLKGMHDAHLYQTNGFHGHHINFALNELAIDGRNIIVSDDKYTMLMLQKDDYRNFTIGYDTNCCQHYGSIGGECLPCYCHDPYAGAVVIVKNSQMYGDKWLTGGAIAQAFTWVDNDKSTIVFDNMEFARAGSINYDEKISEFNDVIAKWAEMMPYENVHVGTSCNCGMNGWGERIRPEEEARIPSTYEKYMGYSDYRGYAGSVSACPRALKRDGIVLLKIKHPDKVKARESTLKECSLDKIKGKEWILGIGGRNIDDSLKFLDEFEKNPTDEMKKEMYDFDPSLVKHFSDNVPIDIQKDIARNHRELAKYIHNPSMEYFGELIKQEPYTIYNYDDPTSDMWKVAVSGNGLLLKDCPYKDNEEIKLAAVRQNGLAIQYISHPDNELQIAAVRTTKEAINCIHNPCHAALMYATGIDQTLVETSIENTVDAEKMHLIENNATAILSIDNPTEAMIEKALSLNGLLIKNFRHTTESEQLTAVRNNAFAIRYIRNPSDDVINAALEKNPGCRKYIHNTTVRNNTMNDLAVEGR